MYRSNVITAWKWLLSHMVIATSFSYLATVLMVGFKVTEPASLLNATTAGIRNVGGPILDQGIALGIDKGVMIFLCNMAVAVLIVAVIYWSRLLNPDVSGRSFPQLRLRLQRDGTARLLKRIPPFSGISSRQLRLTSFLLLGAPYIATIMLGLIAGALLGSVHTLSSSPLLALAYIIPHGIPEVAGLLLACSIPVAIWATIRPVVMHEKPHVAFRQIDLIVASPQFQKDLKMIINLLMIAGLIEAHFTLKIVSLVANS